MKKLLILCLAFVCSCKKELIQTVPITVPIEADPFLVYDGILIYYGGEFEHGYDDNTAGQQVNLYITFEKLVNTTEIKKSVDNRSTQQKIKDSINWQWYIQNLGKAMAESMLNNRREIIY